MNLERRSVLLGSLAFLATSNLAGASQSLTLGEKQIVSVSDGNLVLPAELSFQGLPKTELDEILTRHAISGDQLRPPCNVTLLRDGPRTVLFDAGSGSGFMPSAGALIESLDGLGVSADEITHVIFTHCHPDHLWGVLDDFDDLVFPNAAYLMGRREWDYWRNQNTVNTIGEARASFAVGAARRLLAIEDLCSFFTDGQEVLPGILAHASFGHTPGHMSFEIRSGTESVLIGGDAIGNHHVAFERPDWPSGADQDAATGAKTRQRLLDMLATDKTQLLGFHLPGGGLGRVERKDGAYRFVGEDT